MAMTAYNKALVGGTFGGVSATSVEPILRWILCDLVAKCPPDLVVAAFAGLITALVTGAIIAWVPNSGAATGAPHP